jgi:hypothetical protein
MEELLLPEGPDRTVLGIEVHLTKWYWIGWFLRAAVVVGGLLFALLS